MTDSDTSGPKLMTRLTAALRGEVAAGTVESYRRAGASVYDDLSRAEDVRREIVLEGTDLWSISPGQSSQLLATWNAFVLQALGDQLIEADYRADPRTVGYLPPVTSEQAARFLGEVEQWSALARRASADPAFDVGTVMSVPAHLPGWAEVDPCPVPHVQAMLAAARTIREHVEAAQTDFSHCHLPEARATDADKLRGLVADADAAVSYGESLWRPGSPVAVHERAELSFKRGIEAYYRIGQLLAMPALLDRPEAQALTSSGVTLPLPGEPGFDPWCLTDPGSRRVWQADRAAVSALQSLWRLDPDPASTLRIQAQIDAAVRSEAIQVGADATGRKMGSYYCCPWSGIYLVRLPVVIAGRSLRAGEQFTYDVSAEEMLEGGEFKRELLVGPFHPTDEVDYCDPTSDRG